MAKPRSVDMGGETVGAQVPVAITEFHHAAESPGSYSAYHHVLPPS